MTVPEHPELIEPAPQAPGRRPLHLAAVDLLPDSPTARRHMGIATLHLGLAQYAGARDDPAAIQEARAHLDTARAYIERALSALADTSTPAAWTDGTVFDDGTTWRDLLES